MPWETKQFKYELCLWMLDQVRVRMPRDMARIFAPKIYDIEAEMTTYYKDHTRG